MFWGMHVEEAIGPGGAVGHCLFGDMGGVVIPEQANRVLRRIVRVEVAQQRHKLNAALASFQPGAHMPVL